MVLLLLHGGALLVLSPLNLPPWFILPLSGMVVVSLYHSLKTHAFLRSADAVVELVWEEDGEWRLLTAGGREFKARLLAAAPYAHLVVLSFRMEGGGKRAVVILPDALDASSFRRLRMHLAMRG